MQFALGEIGVKLVGSVPIRRNPICWNPNPKP